MSQSKHAFLPAAARRSAARSYLLAALVWVLTAFGAVAPAWAQPAISSVSAPDETTVEVTFDQDVDPTTAGSTSNYQVFDTEVPSTQFGVTNAAVSGAVVTLTLGTPMTGGRNYTLRSQGIEPLGGGPASGLSIETFDAPFTGTITPIADIQADVAGYEGQEVTVEGQVYIPSDYRGTTISGFIQDSSGRGINLFGDGADVPALRDVGNVVRVTGTVALFETTVEILDITSVVVVSTGNPPLTPTTLSTSAAASASWEGTYIEVSGTVQSSSQGGPGRNYVVDDGSGPIVVRVVDTLGVATIPNGAAVTAAGAGGQFAGDFQVLVGRTADLESSGGNGGETTSIADIQADPAGFEGQVVTVEGQVYIPSDYRGSTISGYIQGSSGRGINVFGDGADVPALRDVGNVVEVTGTVELYFTTVEIVDITSVTVVSSGNTPLSPTVLGTGAAADSQWEGTYIEVSGEIQSSSQGGPGRNYIVDDGSGPIVVRVVDTLGIGVVADGETITAAGAGGQFGEDFQVLVGRAVDFDSGGGPDTTPPTVVGASGAGESSVRVSFSEAVDATTGEQASNYSVFPAGNPGGAINVTSASVNSATVTLSLASSLSDGQDYTVEVTGVEDLAGNVIGASNSATFTFLASGVTPIATIQADPEAFEGQEVTVEGQVYIPTNYRADLTTGFIQDSSGRGINIFGRGADVPAMEDISNVVRVTGEIEIFGTTVEVTNVSEVELVSTDNPPLQPVALSLPAASSSDWEGTYIEVSGLISGAFDTGSGDGLHTNYVITDGTTSFEVRVYSGLGVSADIGETIYARGAGGQFGDTFQILVGNSSDFRTTPFPDLGPPRALRAFLTASNEVTVVFNESLDEQSATDTANYTLVDQSSNQANVQAAFLEGSASVLLQIDRDLSLDDQWEVTISGVADEAGNPIVSPQTLAIAAPPSNELVLDGPARTFLPREGEEYPITVGVPASVATGGNFQGELLLRIFDLQGRLQATLYDSRFEPAADDFGDQTHTITWDGRDEYAERVPAGAYVAHLRVTEDDGGQRLEAQMPIVVAARMER